METLPAEPQPGLALVPRLVSLQMLDQSTVRLFGSRKNQTRFPRMEIVPGAWCPEILALIWKEQL